MTVVPWEPGTYYAAGSEVVFEGVQYKIIQPHTSQSDWTPPVTPALWGRMQQAYQPPPPQQSYGYSDPVPGGGGFGYQPSYAQPAAPAPVDPCPPADPCPPPACPPPAPVQSGADYGEKNWTEQTQQVVEIHETEREKHWYDLDERRKKQLELGGGLAAGVALLGAGYYAYHSHQKSEEEVRRARTPPHAVRGASTFTYTTSTRSTNTGATGQKKAQVWSLQNWVTDAETRTREFYQSGPRGPATWVLAEGGRVPDGALPAGEQHGHQLFVCRAFYEGGIQIGKISPASHQGAVIGYASREIQLPKYEVLVGDPRALRWVDTHGHLDVAKLGARPVEGGREADGTPLYVARVHHGSAVVPGKASKNWNGALVPVNGTEDRQEHYKVLCYA